MRKSDFIIEGFSHDKLTFMISEKNRPRVFLIIKGKVKWDSYTEAEKALESYLKEEKKYV